MKPKITATLLLLIALLLAARAGFLIYNDKHDLRLKLAQNDLHSLLGRFNRVETPEVIVDDQPEEATASVELRRLGAKREQAEKEYRQEVIRLVNERRKWSGRVMLNNQTPDVYPLLELKTHPILEQSARRAFENIAETGRFEHQADLLPRGEPFDDVGENLAAEDYFDAARVVKDFYVSKTHREVMLDGWDYIGVWSGLIEDLTFEDEKLSGKYVTVIHFGYE